MKKRLCVMLLFAALNSHAQVFWTEAFSNGCTSACLANSYSGPNGAWTVTSTGANTASSNKWFVSGAECGNAAGQCGTACGAADASLHIGSDIIIAIDPGAAYYAGIASNWRAESPIINCTGKSNITVSFNYITEGQPGADFAGIAYYDGTTWYYYNGSAWTTTFTALPVTNNASAGCRHISYNTIPQPSQLIGSVFGSNLHGGGELCNCDCLDALTGAATG